ncbi:hypothetical protein QTP88_018961 [Uroleucon formosanum]
MITVYKGFKNLIPIIAVSYPSRAFFFTNELKNNELRPRSPAATVITDSMIILCLHSYAITFFERNGCELAVGPNPGLSGVPRMSGFKRELSSSASH